MNSTINRRLDRLEADAPGKAVVYLFRPSEQTVAEAIAARFGTPTPPPGVNVVIFEWSEGN